MIGSAEVPESLKGLEVRITQLNSLPEALKKLTDRRREICGEIFDALNSQRLARERLFAPVQELIAKNSLIREEYRLKFEAKLGGSIDMLSGELFGLIKQNAGAFRGDDESFAEVRRIADQFDLSTRGGVLDFATALDKKVHEASGGPGIANVLRKDRSASAVYDLVFGLRYLEPRYSLLFQETHIEQLSPGQRGALLLIFYLLVDLGRQPIILDQPEENLDNETVVSLLVPVLTKAKRRRQIIMVTHNPNLAVVCDAEQVIYSSFDRKGGSIIRYTAGAIENPVINRRAVDVLEGTKPAFNNRGGKWQ